MIPTRRRTARAPIFETQSPGRTYSVQGIVGAMRCLCLACLCIAALAQTDSHEPVLRIDVNLVQVDAVVTDSRGRQVTNLSASDFVILEDGRPQKITAFSYVNLGARAAAPAKSVTPIAPNEPPAPPPPTTGQQVRRTIVLMVDDFGLSFESAARVRRALTKFVDEQMRPGDLVAV